MDRGTVITRFQDALPAFRQRYGVAELGLFGSVARGSDEESSDVDVLVRFMPGTNPTLLTIAALACDLEELLGRPVDLVEDHAGLRPEFRATVQRDLIRVA